MSKKVGLSIHEKAYRRGVHQAFAMLEYFIDETGIDSVVALREARSLASDIRGSDKDCEYMLHDILRTIHQKYNKVSE